MASPSVNDITTLNGLFKEVYAKKLVNLIPDGTKLIKLAKFVGKDKANGLNYHMPVVTGLEHGVSYGGSDEGAFDIQQPIAGQIKDAQVIGNQMVLRSALGYAQVTRSMNSEQAFEQATKFLVANMMRSIARKLETNLFYGQMGLSAVSSVTATTITLTVAEFAPGIWSGAERMRLQIYSAAGVLRGECRISSVDLTSSAPVLTVDAVPAGVVATDVIYEWGAKGREAAGLHKILSNTSTLFNIDASLISLWKANSYNAAGALTLAKIEAAVAQSVAKGLDSDVVVLVSIYTWPNILTEQTALRKFDASYSSDTIKNGAREIEFYGQNGAIKIVPSIFVKSGYAFIISPDDLMRVGSTDVTFELPGSDKEAFFQTLENNAGFGLRCYSDQAIFCQAPGKTVLITGIVNS